MSALEMIIQIAFLSKGETTLAANKWLIFGVYKFVSCQFGFDSKLLAAYIAHVILLARMRGDMSQYFLPSAELFATVRARVRKFIGM